MGLGMRGSVWRPQLDDLARDHRLVYFDNRGIGQSAPMAGHPTVRDFADDALRVADAVGWPRMHVVGVSLGGMIAQELTLGHPERVVSLTLIATHAGGPLGIVPRLRGLLGFARIQLGPKAQRVRLLQELLYTRDFLAVVDKDRLDERMQAQVGQRAHPRTIVAQVGAVLRHDTRTRLRTIAAPTLVVRPGADILVRPLHSDRLAKYIPGARMLSIPDAGHGVTFQSAREVSAAIREHVAATSRTAGAT